MGFPRIPVLVISIAALLAACGSESNNDAGNTSEETGFTPVKVAVQGTRKKSLRDGFVMLEANCQEWIEVPTLGPVNIQVPASWGIQKGSSGPRSANVTLVSGKVQKTLEVRMRDQRPGSPPDPDYLGGPEAEAIGAVDWGGEQTTVFAGSYRYSAYFPVISVEGMGDVYAYLLFGGRGRGDILELDRELVLAMFQTASLDRCAADSYAQIFRESEIVFLDET